MDARTRQLFPSEQRAAIDDLLPGKGARTTSAPKRLLPAGLGGLVSEKIGDRVREGKRVVTLRLRTADAPFEVRLRRGRAPLRRQKLTAATFPSRTALFPVFSTVSEAGV